MHKVKMILEATFGKKVREEGNTLKVNVEQLDGVSIYNLNNFNLDRYSDVVESVKVKRSGVGLVVIVTLK